MTVAIRQQHPDTLRQAWGQTLGLTFGTLRFYMTTRKFRWVSRLIMFPLVFITCPVPVVGTALILFTLWRSVRLALTLAKRMDARAARKAQQRAQSVDGARKARTFSIQINIG